MAPKKETNPTINPTTVNPAVLEWTKGKDGEKKDAPSWAAPPLPHISFMEKSVGAESSLLTPLYQPKEIEIAFAKNPIHDNEESLYYYLGLGYKPVFYDRDVVRDLEHARDTNLLCFREARPGPSNTTLIGRDLIVVWIHRSVKEKRDAEALRQTQNLINEGTTNMLRDKGASDNLIESAVRTTKAPVRGDMDTVDAVLQDFDSH